MYLFLRWSLPPIKDQTKLAYSNNDRGKVHRNCGVLDRLVLEVGLGHICVKFKCIICFKILSNQTKIRQTECKVMITKERSTTNEKFMFQTVLLSLLIFIYFMIDLLKSNKEVISESGLPR